VGVHIQLGECRGGSMRLFLYIRGGHNPIQETGGHRLSRRIDFALITARLKCAGASRCRQISMPKNGIVRPMATSMAPIRTDIAFTLPSSMVMVAMESLSWYVTSGLIVILLRAVV